MYNDTTSTNEQRLLRLPFLFFFGLFFPLPLRPLIIIITMIRRKETKKGRGKGGRKKKKRTYARIVRLQIATPHVVSRTRQLNILYPATHFFRPSIHIRSKPHTRSSGRVFGQSFRVASLSQEYTLSLFTSSFASCQAS